MDKVEIKDMDRTSPNNKDQSDMFEDQFFKNLKGLQSKVKQQHLRDAEMKSGDIQYIGDSTRKLVELKLMELDSIITSRNKEQEWVRKREIRQAQQDRLSEARQNLNTLLMLQQADKGGLEDDIEENLAILREVTNIGGEEILTYPEPMSSEKILDSFHVTEKDLRRAFSNTNIVDLMRQAKKNGFNMKISEDEVAVYKNGRRVNGNSRCFIDKKPRKPRVSKATKTTKVTKATKVEKATGRIKATGKIKTPSVKASKASKASKKKTATKRSKKQ